MGDKEMESFNSLKNLLIKQPILKLYDRGAETELLTDASKHGFGAVLLQMDGKITQSCGKERTARGAAVSMGTAVLK